MYIKSKPRLLSPRADPGSAYNLPKPVKPKPVSILPPPACGEQGHLLLLGELGLREAGEGMRSVGATPPSYSLPCWGRASDPHEAVPKSLSEGERPGPGAEGSRGQDCRRATLEADLGMRDEVGGVDL